MFEARISYKDGSERTVEAGSIEMLKSKCVHYINSTEVYCIRVVKVEDIGYLKSDIVKELL